MKTPPTPPAAESALTPAIDTTVEAAKWSVLSVTHMGVDEFPERIHVYQNGALVVDAVADDPTYDALCDLTKKANAHAAAQQRIGELEKALESDNRMFAMVADLLKDGPHVGKAGCVAEQIALNVATLRHPERT